MMGILTKEAIPLNRQCMFHHGNLRCYWFQREGSIVQAQYNLGRLVNLAGCLNQVGLGHAALRRRLWMTLPADSFLGPWIRTLGWQSPIISQTCFFIPMTLL